MLHRESTDIVAGDGRTVVVQLAEWGQPRNVSDANGVKYREAFESMEPAPKVRVKSSHGGDLIGHAVADSYRPDPQPTIELHIAETAAGDDALALIRSGTVDAVSVEFVPGAGDYTADGVLHRVGAQIHNIAMAFNPAHSAPVLAVRENPDPETNPKEPAMTEAIAPDAVTRGDLNDMADTLKREIVTATANIVVHAEPNPLAEFRSLGELTHELVHSDDSERVGMLKRELADQILTDNPGVARPKYIDEIKGTVDAGRPTITAFGTMAVPQGSGSTIQWPVNGNDESTLVGVQAVEKTDVTSVTWSVTEAVAALAMYAGASDISFALIRRSTPAYLNAYAAALYRGYAITTDTAAAAQATAAALTSAGVWDPVTGTGAEFRAALFVASTEVEAATNAPASFVLAGTAVYTAIGGLEDLYPAPYGVQTVSGTADAASLRVNVSGLPVIHDRFLDGATLLVSNSSTADWHEDGPWQASATDVLKAGENAGVYGMGVFTPYNPAGIRQIGNV